MESLGRFMCCGPEPRGWIAIAAQYLRDSASPPATAAESLRAGPRFILP